MKPTSALTLTRNPRQIRGGYACRSSLPQAVGRNGLATEAQRVLRLRRANTLLEQAGFRPAGQPRARSIMKK